MHKCPQCGQSCDCGDDWDDASVMTPEWVAENCSCCWDEHMDEIEDDWRCTEQGDEDG